MGPARQRRGCGRRGRGNLGRRAAPCVSRGARRFTGFRGLPRFAMPRGNGRWDRRLRATDSRQVGSSRSSPRPPLSNGRENSDSSTVRPACVTAAMIALLLLLYHYYKSPRGTVLSCQNRNSDVYSTVPCRSCTYNAETFNSNLCAVRPIERWTKKIKYRAALSQMAGTLETRKF